MQMDLPMHGGGMVIEQLYLDEMIMEKWVT